MFVESHPRLLFSAKPPCSAFIAPAPGISGTGSGRLCVRFLRNSGSLPACQRSDRSSLRAWKRRSRLPQASRGPRRDALTSFTPKSLPLNSFADPHPLNSVVSYLYKNIGGGVAMWSPYHRHVTKNPSLQLLYFPHLQGCDARNSFRICSYANCRVSFGLSPNSQTAPCPSKPFICNTYESPRKCCKQKTYGQTNSFRCNTYKNTGGPPVVAPYRYVASTYPLYLPLLRKQRGRGGILPILELPPSRRPTRFR